MTRQILERIVAAIAFGALAMLSSGCGGAWSSNGRSRIPFDDSDEVAVVTMRDSIVDAIATRDPYALTSLFSAQAIQETTDYAPELDALLKSIPDDIRVVGEYNGWSRTDIIEYDAAVYRLNSSWRIEANGRNYYMFIVQTSLDSTDPSNVGLWSLRVVDGAVGDPEVWDPFEAPPGIHSEP